MSSGIANEPGAQKGLESHAHVCNLAEKSQILLFLDLCVVIRKSEFQTEFIYCCWDLAFILIPRWSLFGRIFRLTKDFLPLHCIID